MDPKPNLTRIFKPFYDRDLDVENKILKVNLEETSTEIHS